MLHVLTYRTGTPWCPVLQFSYVLLYDLQLTSYNNIASQLLINLLLLVCTDLQSCILFKLKSTLSFLSDGDCMLLTSHSTQCRVPLQELSLPVNCLPLSH